MITLKLYIIIFLIIPIGIILSQQSKIDSLKNSLDNTTDTTRINILIDLTEELLNIADLDAENYASEYFHLSDSLNYEKGLTFSIYHQARIALHKGDYSKALKLFDECIVLFMDKYSPKYLVASYLQASGAAKYLNEYDQALKYQMAGLKVSESIGNTQLIASSLRFIGQTYSAIGEKDRALEYCLKAFSIMKTEEPGIAFARIVLQIGDLYFQKGEFDLALDYFNRSLKIAKKIGSKHQEVLSILSIGKCYSSQHRPKEALLYLQQGLKQSKEINDERQTVYGLSELSMVYYQLGDLMKAKEIGMLAYESAKDMPLELQDDILPDLLLVLEAAKDYKTALKLSNIYISVKDSLNKQQNNREIGRLEVKHEYERQAAVEEKQRLEEQQQEDRNTIILLTSLGVLIVLVVVGIFYTRTLNKKNKLITEQKNKLEELDKSKSIFFTNISHEFRTPLTLILSPIKALISRINNDDDKRELKLVETNANKLLRFINQLLALSKLESGEMTRSVSRIDIAQRIKTITESFASIAKQRSIDYKQSFQFPNIISDFDPDHLEKIVYNILSNAFKFTKDHGSISVKVNLYNSERQIIGDKNDSRNDNILLCINISDTGIGIEKENLDKIFDRFYQVEQTSTRDYEGTGVGLALVKELVEFNDGKINIDSELNKGSVFKVFLPLKKIYSIDEIPLTEQTELDVGRDEFSTEVDKTINNLEENSESIQEKEVILIVEDNIELRSHISNILENNFKVLEAKNGEQGFEAAVESVPDLIISDIMMPVRNGIEMSKDIINDERTSHIPIILLTAKAALEDKIEGLETGAIDYITKPFDTDELKLKILNQIGLRKELHKKFKAESLIKLSDIDVTSANEKFLKRAVKIIEDNIEKENFSTEDFASEMGLSRVQLHRKISALTNKPATNFIRSIRLERAAQLLQNGAGNVTEVAYMVGFNSQSYFTKRFVEHFGKTPTEFQTQ